jgi:hypothetical protein
MHPGGSPHRDFLYLNAPVFQIKNADQQPTNS